MSSPTRNVIITASLLLSAFAATAEVKLYEYMTVTGAADNQASGIYTITDYIPKKDTVIRAKYSTSSVGTQNNNQFLFCSRIDTRDPGGLNFSYAANVGGKPRWDYNNSKLAPTFAYEANSAYELEIKNGIVTLTKEGASSPAATIGSGVEDFTPAYKLCFFQSYTMNGNDYAGFGNSFHGRFYYLKVFELEGGVEVLKHWYVPCAEDGVVKVCDLADDNKLWPLTVISSGGANITGASEVHLSMQEIHADYSIGEGKLNTSVTTKAQTYPVQTWFCCGATDGGYDPSAWDRVVEAGMSTAEDVPFEEHRVVDFKYCRYYFEDSSAADPSMSKVWSETFKLVDEPVADFALVTHGARKLGYQVTPTSCGGTNDYVKVSAAIAPHGQTMPELTEVKSGVVVGEAVAIDFGDLSPASEYDYQVRLENGEGKYVDISRSITTRSTREWSKGRYDMSTWTLPENWLSPCGDGWDVQNNKGLVNAKVIGAEGGERVGLNDTVFHARFNAAKDIERIVVFMNSNTKIEVKKVEMLFDGDVEFMELPNSSVDYTEDTSDTSARKLEFFDVDGGLVAENVKEILVTFGKCEPNNVGGSEVCVIGSPHVGDVQWRVGFETDSTYAPSSDELPGVTLSDSYKANLTDHDLATTAIDIYQYWSGGDIVWEFDRPKEIRSLRFISATVSDYQGFCVKGVWVKYKGDEDYTYVEGSDLDKFFFGAGQYAALGTRSGKGYFARGVMAVKATLGVWDWRIRLAEVECCGKDRVGMSIIYR